MNIHTELQKESKVKIRPMLSSDLEPIVETHLKSFPGFFLSFLGHDFLGLLYESIRSDPEGIILVADSQEQIEGFVAGVVHQRGFYQYLIRKRKWAFAMATLGPLLRNPTIAPRLLRAFRQPTEAQQAASEALLMSIAVRPECEGKGVGSQLVEAFCHELARHGAQDVCLTTDRDNNDRANRFYQNLGFRVSRAYMTPEGRAINEYVISLA